MSNIQEQLVFQREIFDGGKTKDVSYRASLLATLRENIIRYEADVLSALHKDLNKAPFEAYATEVGIVLEEIKFILKHLLNWSRPKRAKTPFLHFPSSSRIYAEPYGVVLIISPWNYPFQLAMVPLIGAIAAGNCAFVKPSEYSFHTAEIIEKIIKETFSENEVSVIRGGRDANKSLLDEKFDYIFFTGSPEVGKIVIKSAAKHLTPTTLELGGKSPCVVDSTANVPLSAKRIVWGKFLNAGQTCVAPDYILAHSSVKEKLVHEMTKYISLFYGNSPETNKEYPKIINQKHFDRLARLLNSGKITTGGALNEKTLQIAPTIIEDVTWESAVMQEEIFGPILPIIEFDSFQDLCFTLKSKPKPLALYLFTTSKANEAEIMRSLSFGGGCVNDTVIHLSNPHLPFSGVGESGIGGYHGKASFDTFSHHKSVIKKYNFCDIFLRYPPFKNHLGLLKKIMK